MAQGPDIVKVSSAIVWGTGESMTENKTTRSKHAASLVVLRDETHVLMGMRHAGHRFLPNRLVFPGGKVDLADYRADFASALRPDVLRRLEKASSARLAPALALAAARELQEETGLSLGTPPHLGKMDFLCRAITPPTMPIRFDARFLVVDATEVHGDIQGSGELEGLRYYGLAEALALELAAPTRFVLQQLQAYLALDEAARRRRDHTAVLRRRAPP
jgi:8-oxo-dGTP pyrophosphatase MutT (NUDIX family)